MAFNSNANARDEMQMLTFSLDDVLYGVNVSQVREVKNFEGVTPVPYAPSYVRGVTNLRGEVIPVIDLRRRFLREPTANTVKTSIIISDLEELSVGLIVDSVAEVLPVTAENVKPPAAGGDHVRAFLKGIGNCGGEAVLIIDAEKLLTPDEIRILSAVL
jgi:purine-binding chemotaxis protein CheW